MGFEVKGWCPGAHRPMMSGDGLVVRLSAPFGRLSQATGAAVADLATRFGNGLIDVTARGNLQIRGVRDGDHPALMAELSALSLVAPDALTETRLTMTITPFWQEGCESHQIARALTQTLQQASDLILPGKFGFVVDCGHVPQLRATSGDIRLERGVAGLICRADGCAQGVTVEPENAADVALDLARWFVESGGAPVGRGRMARHLARVELPERFRTDAALGTPSDMHGPGPTPMGQMVAVAFGQIDARTLAQLARIAPLRVTPWRMLLLEDTDATPALPGLITDRTNPLLRVDACPGSPFCPQAKAETRALAAQVAPHVSGRLHVSGCAKGCARPKPADVVLTASEAGFDLAFNARAGDTPLERGLNPAQTLAHFGAT